MIDFLAGRLREKMEVNEIDALILSVLHTSISPYLSMQNEVSFEALKKLINSTMSMLDEEPALLKLEGELQIIGDIHGNVADLIRIFERFGYPPQTRYLFLGDYIDRGDCGVEVVSLLFALKLRFPKCIFLLRGNHELRHISLSYGFFDEIYLKYPQVIFELFHRAFQCLPLAAVVNSEIFCVHGGISPSLLSISQLEKIKKPSNVTGSGLVSDLLWSDPREQLEEFSSNQRGCGCYFNLLALEKFLDSNKLTKLVRSHESCSKGFDYPFEDSVKCLTIFSNTAYCGMSNEAGMLSVQKDRSSEIIVLPVLTAEEKTMRRLHIPPWLEESAMKQPISIDISPDSEPQSEWDEKKTIASVSIAPEPLVQPTE